MLTLEAELKRLQHEQAVIAKTEAELSFL